MAEYDRSLEEIKEEIRARSDIVEIIGGYTKLKRGGKSWTGLCPFHGDKKPSFSVSPAFQHYTCWSCGEKGDVFTFIQKKENLDFVEALEFLARRAGIPFERHGARANPEQASELDQMRELNLIAARYFQDKLTRSPDAQAYLARRGVLKATQEQFQLGFAAPEWEGLLFSLQRGGADLKLAEKVGLIKRRESEGTGYYDVYRNRLIFPICDSNGRIVAFGGRVMDDSLPKYINGAETPLFSKSKTLYGLHLAKKRLSGDISPIFVEGYLDVITAHQAGFSQCVATLGTAMTDDHARMLSRYSTRVILCYDSDRAGISAALKGANIWESQGIEGAEARIALLPDGQDPDSLLKGGDTAAFQAALDKAVPRVEFQIHLALRRHDVKTEKGKEEALAEIVPILASISSLTRRERYAQNLAHLHPANQFDAKRAVASLLADIEAYARQTDGAKSPRDQGYPRTEQANRAPLAEQPPPPGYRPPRAGEWGQWEPGTRNVVRRGEGAPSGYSPRGQSGYGGAQGGFRSRLRDRQSGRPMSDPTPPSLSAPALSGAEKAERQVLRAMFSPDWRAFILNNLHPGYLLTDPGRRLFEIVARTTPNAEGGIDPLPLLLQAERDERERSQVDAAPAPPAFPTAGAAFTGGSPSGIHASDPSSDAASASTPELFPTEEGVWSSLGEATTASDSYARSHSAKISDFIRELLEDSLSVMSNEPLNEAAVRDCIRRLQKHREDQAKRELAEMLKRPDLSPEQQRACMDQYHETMRAMRGSPPEAG